MKKVMIGILAFVMMIGIIGCGNTSEPKYDGTSETILTLENYDEYLNIDLTDFVIKVTPKESGNYENVNVKIRLSYPATYVISKPESVIREEGNRSALYSFTLLSDGKYSEAVEFTTLFGAEESEVGISVVSISGTYIPE